jgi:hypothetical protein
MKFVQWTMVFCDLMLSQRSFDLIVAPALADMEFEEASGRRSALSNRAAVVRAAAGALIYEWLRGSGDFFKLALLSVSYFLFPVAVSGSIFKTWTEYLVAALIVVLLALVPVLACFWPSRYPMQSGD